tara:strand:+ start:1198 stop:2142 length:945 start_codon:yes stop_codon:yes gene_type:complete
MKILISEPYEFPDEAISILQLLGELTLKNCDRRELLEAIPTYDVIFTRLAHKLDKEFFDKSKNLKIIVSPTTGLNHIDLGEAKVKGIEILSLKGESEFLKNISATAELAWGLIISISRNLNEAINHVANGHWDRDKFKGAQLRGKTLGIIGFGRLGKMIAEYGNAFGMEVLYSDPNVNSSAEDAQKVDLIKLLENSDVISIHVNYSNETHKLIGSNILSKIKKCPVIINTSRGEIIDELAVVEALNNKIISGYATDVLFDETSLDEDWLSKNVLWNHTQRNKILISPHIGGATNETIPASEIYLSEKLKSFLIS